MEFHGARVWITGASSGIGRALAVNLARQGARVLLSGRDPDRLDDARAACGPDARALPFDLADADAVARAPRLAHERMGGAFDLLVNNAGQSQRGLALETEWELVERLLAVDFRAAVELTRAVLPPMLERKRGRVAAVTSLLGKFGAPRRSAYAAAKHALHGWFDSLRAELHGSGVGVTLLVPGWIRTGISLHAWDAQGVPHGQVDPGQQRGLDPDECARRMARALARDVDEQLIGGWECIAAYGKRFFPKWLARRIARGGVG